MMCMKQSAEKNKWQYALTLKRINGPRAELSSGGASGLAAFDRNLCPELFFVLFEMTLLVFSATAAPAVVVPAEIPRLTLFFAGCKDSTHTFQ